MRVVNCLIYDHNLLLVLLAALMCTAGSFVTVKLAARTLNETGPARLHWTLLSAVTAGAAIWATHFIAMLGYDPGVPVSFHATLTIVSALIAVVGCGAGLLLASLRQRWIAALCGGGLIGLSISAMHYVGMFAYRAEGIVQWLPEYVFLSIACAILLSALAIDRLRHHAGDGRSVDRHRPSGRCHRDSPFRGHGRIRSSADRRDGYRGRQ